MDTEPRGAEYGHEANDAGRLVGLRPWAMTDVSGTLVCQIAKADKGLHSLSGGHFGLDLFHLPSAHALVCEDYGRFADRQEIGGDSRPRNCPLISRQRPR